MRSKLVLLSLFLVAASAVSAQKKPSLTGSAVARPDFPVILDVDYSGGEPDGNSPYLTKENWKVRWSKGPDEAPAPVHVDTVTLSAEHFSLHVSGTMPTGGDPRGVYWTILFDPSDAVPLLPQLASATPNRRNQPNPQPADCSNSDPSMQPAFCPSGGGSSPDFSLTGSFLAGGGTKPIIAAQLKTDLIFSSRWEKWEFYPGLNLDVEMNQDVQPPNNRTRFDPDSISAGLSFYKTIPKDQLPLLSSVGSLYGIKLQAQIPAGEFSRTDPSSNIMSGASAKFVFKPLQRGSFYATLYPVLGLEGGRNLNRPSRIDNVAVDLSHYRGIFRGVAGTDAAVGVASAKGRRTDVFSITASYRVRLPTMDEPFVKTIHQATTADLTTKARHWVEINMNSSPWSWKFLALNAKYQYGDLPPLFTLIDHKFTVGFTLQAVQTSKPDVK